MAKLNDEIAAVVQQRLSRHMESLIEREVFGDMTNTTTVQEELPTLNVETMLEDLRKMLMASRRNSITFQVDEAHEGPALKHSTPNDGDIVEMSYRQLCALHEQWPVKLHKVHSTDRADFVPANMFDTFIAMRPPGPPWDVPPEETFEEWMQQIKKE